jgi:hydroxymethylpyrimidine pyrophosphatase-like HAD family hydrolase
MQDNMFETLEKLHKSGVTIGVVSGSDYPKIKSQMTEKGM